MNLRNSIMCKNAVFAMVAFVAAVLVALGAAVLTSTTEAYADQQAFTTGGEAKSGATWIYVDGQNGDDSNTGESADKAVKTWDKAKNLLACNEGGIIVVGTVDASGAIYTKAPSKQVVKRESDIVMFNVSGEATFTNIDVDGGGASNNFDSPAIQPASGSTLNFLSGAVFHDVGYDGWSEELPTTLTGGVVCALTSNLNILIDGATFENNAGKGIFFAPLGGGTSGGSATDVHVYMKSGTVTGNKGHFYHNEVNDTDSNTITVYNALVKNNDGSNIPTRYTNYAGRTGVVYVCNEGIMRIRSLDGAAIFDNTSHDLIYLDPYGDTPRVKFQGTALEDTSGNVMLGGGNPAWGEAAEISNGYWGYKASPSADDKAKGEAAATSIFTNNGALFDSNGTVTFGRYSNENQPETPSVKLDQGCDDEPTDDGKENTEEKIEKEDKKPVNAPAGPSEDTTGDKKTTEDNKTTDDKKEADDKDKKDESSEATSSENNNANNSSNTQSSPAKSNTVNANQSTPSKASTPKTADGAGTAVIALGTLAVVAMAAGLYSLRRREER